MAKSDPFLIRAQITMSHTGQAAVQTEIDLGSYTNLGSSKPEILRIHKLDFMVTDSTQDYPTVNTNATAALAWQLCTSENSGALVSPVDDSFIAGAAITMRNPDGSGARQPSEGIEQNVMPQDYVDGYVVAVPSLFLIGFVDEDFAEDVVLTVLLQCTTESMTKANAVALAISQQ